MPSGGTKPKIGIAAHARTASRRWIAAAIGGYHDGENTLADELEGSFTAGILNLADRGFFSVDRWIRFSADGAHLAWRVKNGAKSVPFKTIRPLPDGPELVLLRESGSMLGKRRRERGDKALPRLPDTVARLVSFTVTTRTARRAKTTTDGVISGIPRRVADTLQVFDDAVLPPGKLLWRIFPASMSHKDVPVIGRADRPAGASQRRSAAEGGYCRRGGSS